MGQKVFVVGVGMTKFEKPGSRDWDYPDMAREAGTKALADAGISFASVQQAVTGYCYGESTSGQRAVYELGCTGIPIYNVNNNCATASSALFLAKQLVEGGIADCVLALGFEKMRPGSLSTTFQDRTSPLEPFVDVMTELCGPAVGPPAPQLFANVGKEHMERHGTTAEQFAKVGLKNHAHSVNNPYSQFQHEVTFEDVLSSRMIAEPLTLLQCSPTSDGSAAAVVASERFVRENGLEATAVEILGQAMATDFPSTWDDKSMIKLVGSEVTKAAALEVYDQSGLGPENVDVIELHDCFSTNEIIMYEALGLCAEGQGGTLIDEGATDYGGTWVVNPSGGLISKGHPLGATGLAQCAELNWQLRGVAGKRQVPGAAVALQHNIGLGGACVVTMYRKIATDT
ncbi:lipid-transfer protein [Actinomadura sp. B10D3]|uniref:lipid-transfer protein n=1 Tax=Actinomadura sp. B10D3 TaxID=3153557 RepID=UPI00325EF727